MGFVFSAKVNQAGFLAQAALIDDLDSELASFFTTADAALNFTRMQIPILQQQTDQTRQQVLRIGRLLNQAVDLWTGVIVAMTKYVEGRERYAQQWMGTYKALQRSRFQDGWIPLVTLFL